MSNFDLLRAVARAGRRMIDGRIALRRALKRDAEVLARVRARRHFEQTQIAKVDAAEDRAFSRANKNFARADDLRLKQIARAEAEYARQREVIGAALGRVNDRAAELRARAKERVAAVEAERVGPQAEIATAYAELEEAARERSLAQVALQQARQT